MIRRVLSILLFAFGGWMLMSEQVVAFFDMEPGLSDNATMVGIFAIIAGIPLFLGTWASPGDRWRELGLTLLVTSGIGGSLVLTMALFLNDPTARPFLGAAPSLKWAPIIGATNFLFVAAAGWWLYRPGPRQVKAGH